VINLATHPFRNERLPATLFAAGVAFTFLLTLAHGGAAFWLLRRGGPDAAVRAREAELAALRRESAAPRTPLPDAATLARWRAIQDLVDQRMFSWSRLFGQLEQSLPRQVRLLSVQPKVEKGDIVLRLSAVADPAEEGLALIEVLESEGPFAQVYPLSVNELESGAKYDYELRYRQPALMVAAQPAASPSPGVSGSVR
jgi:hypothetical protein